VIEFLKLLGVLSVTLFFLAILVALIRHWSPPKWPPPPRGESLEIGPHMDGDTRARLLAGTVSRVSRVDEARLELPTAQR